jgi:hypothetical protein
MMKAQQQLFEMAKMRGVCFIARFVAVGQARRVQGVKEKPGQVPKKYDFITFRATVLRTSEEGTQYPMELEETADVGKASRFAGLTTMQDIIVRASLKAGKSADRPTVRFHVLEVVPVE